MQNMGAEMIVRRILRWWCLFLLLPSIATAGQLGQNSGSSYPATLDTKTTFTDKTSCNTSITTRICAATPNDLQAAIVNIETELGLLPKGSYATVVARLNAAAYLTTANTFTAVQTLSLVTPSFVMTDTTALAKSLTIAVGSNVANFRESAGASGSLLALDLANLRVGIGTASPAAKLHITGVGNNTPSPSNTTASNGLARFVSGNGIYFDVGATLGTPVWGVWVQAGDVAASNYYPLSLNPNGGNVGIGTMSPNVGLEMGATLNVRIPNIKSTTGVRYVCVDTLGSLTSQAAACSGT